MVIRYGYLFLTALICVAVHQGVRAEKVTTTSQGVLAHSAQVAQTCIAQKCIAQDAARVTYAMMVKKCIADLYVRCKEYRELCGLGLAFACAYVSYKLSTMTKKPELDEVCEAQL
jgi:hypothetical protein